MFIIRDAIGAGDAAVVRGALRGLIEGKTR